MDEFRDRFPRSATRERIPEDDNYIDEPLEEEPISDDEQLVSLFGEYSRPNYRIVWDMYEKGLGFNQNINLDETVMVNENFFIGKQWEGVPSNNLPTPQINILKRVGLFTIATIVSDNIKVTSAALANTVGTSNYKQLVQVVNDEFEAIFERNKVAALIRKFARNACVDGDGCIYVYWDADAETGQMAKGQICCEIIENTRVFFGNPSDVRIEEQPWIIISRRIPARKARLMARDNGSPDWRTIAAHGDESSVVDSAKANDDLTSILQLFWKD